MGKPFFCLSCWDGYSLRSIFLGWIAPIHCSFWAGQPLDILHKPHFGLDSPRPLQFFGLDSPFTICLDHILGWIAPSHHSFWAGQPLTNLTGYSFGLKMANSLLAGSAASPMVPTNVTGHMLGWIAPIKIKFWAGQPLLNLTGHILGWIPQSN